MRKLREQDALQFVRHLSEIYFSKRDMERLLDSMELRTSWIGTGREELCRDLEDAKRALRLELEEYAGRFTVVTDAGLKFEPLGETGGVVYGAILATPENPELAEEHLRVSVVLEQTEAGLRLVHLHLSHPDEAQDLGRYFVKRSARTETQQLRHTLEMQTRQLANLTQNIPGGTHRCASDAELTLLSMSDGFLAMFGYTRQEIETLFHGKFMNMVYPGDRVNMTTTIRSQLERGAEIELEYRVLRKHGAPVWVLDKGRLLEDASGARSFYCLLIDITARKRQQEELRLSLERHKVIMDQATDIIFEWDIRADTLAFSANFYKKFGYEPTDRDISRRLPHSTKIHPEDAEAFVTLMKNTAAGKPYSETEFRIQDDQGRYLWCRIRATTQYDPDQRPIKAVGVIVDIDAEKKQRQDLVDQARRDALTGLYNKTAIRSLVEQRLQDGGSSGVQALLIVDVDHFKTVNDTYGHLCGDSVLSNVAAALKSNTRASDLVGRIGGDEFLVYLQGLPTQEFIYQKTEQLLAAIQRIVPFPGCAPITCSIGVAVFPGGKANYLSLYQNADQALYLQKHQGRSGASFHIPGAENEPTSLTMPTAVNDNIVSAQSAVLDQGLAQYAFRSLYTAGDIGSAIQRLLAIIGRSFDVSRVYIFENSRDGSHCSNTFEWCSEGIEPQIQQLQELAYAEIGNHLDNFDENGLFFCHDIRQMHPDSQAVLRPQGIFSMLHCAMLDEGRIVGYVGFDECRENRVWDAHQVDAFKLTADVLSTFVLKLRLKERGL